MEEIEWQKEDYHFHGDERIWLGVRKDGRWVASLGGKRARPGAPVVAAPPGKHMVPGDYESKDAAFEAAKKFIDEEH